MSRWFKQDEPDTALITELRARIAITEKWLEEERALVRSLIEHNPETVEKYAKLMQAAPPPPMLMPAQRDVPPELIRAVRTVSPTRDKTYEYNMELVWQHEYLWDNEHEVRKLADMIVRGAVVQ